jgi:prepilin-type N-terminal cleavage/methylation domain-containing protein
MKRQGFTILETMLALGILATAMVLAAQVGYWSMADRLRGEARQEALELAANILESARAVRPEDLTAEWAAAQQLPASSVLRPRQGKLTVRVESEETRPLVKRVTVLVEWQQDDGSPVRPVKLVGLFAARSAPAEGKP